MEALTMLIYAYRCLSMLADAYGIPKYAKVCLNMPAELLCCC